MRSPSSVTRAWSNPRMVADPLACPYSTMRRHCAAFCGPVPFSDQGRTSPWLVEAFQSGEQYRVDGVCRDGRVISAAAAIYVNTHLDFLGGGYMGSVMLPEESEEAQTVLELARSVLEDALPAYRRRISSRGVPHTGGSGLQRSRGSDRWRFHSGGGRTLLRVQPRRGGDSRPARGAFPPHRGRPAQAGGTAELLSGVGDSHRSPAEVSSIRMLSCRRSRHRGRASPR